MKKIYSGLLSIILAFICCNVVFAAGNPDEEKVLVYGSADFTRINPAMDEHGEINILIFNGLTAHDGDNNIIPCLAENWEYKEDSCTYVFHLAKGVKWHDGELFTAEDVKFTIEAIMNPENGSENAPDYEDITEINVIDDFTVEFVLESANSAFLEYMTKAVLPKHLLEGEDMQTSDFFRHPIGTGPYKLVEWEMGQSIILEKNEDYFLGAANIDKIIFKISADDSARAMQLLSGELDICQVTPRDSEMFEGKEEYTVYDMKTSDYRGILYNFNNEYWQKNADIIPAISYAVDKNAILESVILGKGTTAYGPLQRNVYNCEDVEHFDYSPEKSESIMLAAGCEKDTDGFWTRNGERICFTINASPGDRVRIDMAQIAAQQLREAGFDVKADVPAEGIDWGGQECCIIGWGSPFDADDHTYKVFGTGKGANYSGYSNEDVDLYLTLARQTDNEEERKEYYALFQKALADNPAYTFFCYIDAVYVSDSNISGIDAETVLGHHGVGIFWNVCEWDIN